MEGTSRRELYAIARIMRAMGIVVHDSCSRVLERHPRMVVTSGPWTSWSMILAYGFLRGIQGWWLQAGFDFELRTMIVPW